MHWGLLNASGNIISALKNIQCIGGYSVHWRIFSALVDIQCTGGYSVHWWIFSALVDILSGLKDITICVGRLLIETISFISKLTSFNALMRYPKRTHNSPHPKKCIEF